MSNEYMSAEVKEGREYVEVYRTTDEAEILRSLCESLIYKKLLNSSSIRSITQKPNYDGTRRITISESNGTRRIYRVKC